MSLLKSQHYTADQRHFLTALTIGRFADAVTLGGTMNTEATRQVLDLLIQLRFDALSYGYWVRTDGAVDTKRRSPAQARA